MEIKKIIAPIIITILLIIYLSFFIWGWSIISVPILIRVIGLVIPLALIGVSIFVLIERIKEIRSGEEDDLSKYWLYHWQGVRNAWNSQGEYNSK